MIILLENIKYFAADFDIAKACQVTGTFLDKVVRILQTFVDSVA
jgi:hypothetical protein